MKYLFLSLTLLLLHFQSSPSKAQSLDLTLEEGNHTWAKSESWTWMGHLNEYSMEKGQIVISEKGVGLIHYYTRNQTQFGSMNFKSSALTPTQNGIGESYDKKTIYADASKQKSFFQLKINENILDIDFRHEEELDVIRATPMTGEDLEILRDQLLPIYPGLKISDQFSPVKYRFSAFVGNHSYLDLNLYQIWPAVSPPEAKMKFLGIPDSYTFSQPMLVAIGTLKQAGVVKPVVGLMFLDRQWCRDYFGKFIMGNPTDGLEKNQALKYSHDWSAFHAHSVDSQNWYFVHLWQQYNRIAEESDAVSDYSGIVWVKNGVQQAPIPREDFDWSGFSYIKNKSNVMLNYAVGRESYFPTQYQLRNKFNHQSLNIQATPKLQSLDQPIYLYEGYASGDGFWNDEAVKVQGRLESSRILFRPQDYVGMVSQISKNDQSGEQQNLKQHLKKIIQQEESCKNNILCLGLFIKNKKAQMDYLLNALKQKMAIFRSGFRSKAARRDSKNLSAVIYE